VHATFLAQHVRLQRWCGQVTELSAPKSIENPPRQYRRSSSTHALAPCAHAHVRSQRGHDRRSACRCQVLPSVTKACALRSRRQTRQSVRARACADIGTRSGVGAKNPGVLGCGWACAHRARAGVANVVRDVWVLVELGLPGPAGGVRRRVPAHADAHSQARVTNLNILPLLARTETLPSHVQTLAVWPTGVEPPQIHRCSAKRLNCAGRRTCLP